MIPPHPLPAPPGAPPRQRPAAALRALAAQLRTAGLTRVYGSACALVGVLSVSYGLTVWTDGRVFWWRREDQEIRWPAADPGGAARQLLRKD
jgi:hypothetical protein